MTRKTRRGDERHLDGAAAESRRLEVLGRLAAGVAHDFNNVLAAIRGYSQLALRSLDDAAAGPRTDRGAESDVLERVRADVAAIDEGARRAAVLTRQLATLTRPAGADVVPLDLNAFASELHSLARRLLPAAVETSVATTPGRLPALANEPALLQATLRLVLDLCDAIGAAGAIELATIGAHGVPPLVTLVVRAPGSSVTPATAQAIALARALLAPFGGELRQGDSSTHASLEVSLPAAEERRAESPARSAGARSAVALEGSTVLLVEDDPAVRRIARTLLERLGYRVVPAGDGDEALRLAALLESDGVVPDLLVTDVSMPGMSGPALAAELRERAPRLGVLFMSGMGEPSLAEGQSDGGRDDFLEKPFTLDELAARVAGLLAAR